jgi:hypothetical protein
MTLVFSQADKVKVRKHDYVKELLEEAPDDTTGELVTPAADHLFVVNSNNMLIYIIIFCFSRREHARILCTSRVKSPDVDDRKKMGRVIKYLHGSKELELAHWRQTGPR